MINYSKKSRDYRTMTRFNHGEPQKVPVISLLEVRHWLPILQWINFKLFTVCYHVLTQTAPVYREDMLFPGRWLRSLSDSRTIKNCILSVIYARWWNNFSLSGIQTLRIKVFKNPSLPTCVPPPDSSTSSHSSSPHRSTRLNVWRTDSKDIVLFNPN